jgi:glycine/D-amino acid oxidase-like deaminating enzyme
MNICVIGSGIAGSLLAWRLARAGEDVELVLGPVQHRDATGVSGGLVRGYEPTRAQRDLAVASLLELATDERVRAWARYAEVSSVWAVPQLESLTAAAAELEEQLPGSVELRTAAELTALGWRGLPDGGGAIVERRAGYLDPGALRDAVIDDLAARSNVSLQTCPSGRADLTVVAAGAWTHRVLANLGLDPQPLRTKSIQYALHYTAEWRPTPFCDTTTGLYGRPYGDGMLLLGLPTDDWAVDPDRLRPDPSLAESAAYLAGRRFPSLALSPVLRIVTAADCYGPEPVLDLRPAGANTYTFTGGSGGAAKSALAASSRAAAALVSTPTLIGQQP